MPKQLILFDFDGTIVDTFPVFLAFASREGFTYEAGKIGELRNLSMREAITKFRIPGWRVMLLALKFHRYFRKASNGVRLIGGVDTAVRKLHDAGHMLGIVTSNSAANVRTILKHEDLTDCFEYVFAERNVFGKARSLRKIVRLLGTDPAEAWYVGDEVRDVEAAREAGLQSVSVTWGFNSDSVLRQAHPNRLVGKPDELPGIFD